MSKFIVQGGYALSGAVSVEGSKNAAFPVIAATLLTEETCVVENVPHLSDVSDMLEIMKSLGVSVKFENGRLEINARNAKSSDMPRPAVKRFRGSILFAGALLGRFKQVTFPLPGGCLIGNRPIDVHLDGFKKLGASVEEGELIEIKAESGLRGAKIVPVVTTVTGTENLILASVLAEGVTEIRLAASEPHVQDLCRFLIKMGAKIDGVGTTNLKIIGVSKLKGATHSLVSDNIVAVTYAIAAAATRSEVKVKDIDVDCLDAPLAALERMNVKFEVGSDYVLVQKTDEPYVGTRILTGVYPQLMTDVQPLFGVLATQARGRTDVHDWIWEGRLGYLKKLGKMGAKFEITDEHRAKIYGPVKLRGATIKTPDLRAGASILIAALVAEGETVINDAEIIDRGYEQIAQKLRDLGASIERVE